MMKLTLSILTILLLPGLNFSQTERIHSLSIKFEEGTEFESSSLFYLASQIIPLSDGRTILRTDEGREAINQSFLYLMNENGDVQKREEVQLENDYLVFIHKRGEELFAFTSRVEDESEFLSLWTLDTANFEFTLIERDISSHPHGLIEYTPNQDQKNTTVGRRIIYNAKINASKYSLGYRFQYSRDQELLMWHAVLPGKKKDMQQVQVGVMSAEPKLLWETTVELPFDMRVTNINDIHLDTKGDVHIAVASDPYDLLHPPLAYRGWKLQEYATIIRVSDQGRLVSKMTVEKADDFYLTKLMLVSGKKGKTTFVSDYRNPKEQWNGLVVYEVDWESNTISQRERVWFDSQLYDGEAVAKSSFKTEPKGRFGSKIVTDQIVELLDGSFYVLTTNRRSAQNRSMRYESLVVTLFDASGEAVWARMVPFKQEFVDYYKTSAFSYGLLNVDNLVLPFNNSVDRDLVNAPEDAKYYRMDQMTFQPREKAVYVLDLNGKLTFARTPIVDGRGLLLVPSTAVSTGNAGEWILLANKNNGSKSSALQLVRLKVTF